MARRKVHARAASLAREVGQRAAPEVGHAHVQKVGHAAARAAPVRTLPVLVAESREVVRDHEVGLQRLAAEEEVMMLLGVTAVAAESQEVGHAHVVRGLGHVQGHAAVHLQRVTEVSHRLEVAHDRTAPPDRHTPEQDRHMDQDLMAAAAVMLLLVTVVVVRRALVTKQWTPWRKAVVTVTLDMMTQLIE